MTPMPLLLPVAAVRSLSPILRCAMGLPDIQRLPVGDTPPSTEVLAGTDTLGRDILSRVIVGNRTAIVGPTVIAAAVFAIAAVPGLVAGDFVGLVHSAILRRVDIVLTPPGPLIAIVADVTGGGYKAAFGVPVQRSRPYIEACRIPNIGRARILFVHILPNVLPLIRS